MQQQGAETVDRRKEREDEGEMAVGMNARGRDLRLKMALHSQKGTVIL